MERVLKIDLRKKKIANKAQEKIQRSILKTITWRIIGTLDTVIISWVITGAFTIAFSIGLIELITKSMLYFFHERTWNQIKWGK